jgi:hypothetical protein
MIDLEVVKTAKKFIELVILAKGYLNLVHTLFLGVKFRKTGKDGRMLSSSLSHLMYSRSWENTPEEIFLIYYAGNSSVHRCCTKKIRDLN